MIYGKIDKMGEVTLKWNEQSDRLMVGDIQILPCEVCGVVVQCAENVVSILCKHCQKDLELDERAA